MRLKNVSDRATFDFIRGGNRNILNHLFERNLVNALNLLEPYVPEEKEVHEMLANSVVLTWEYFSANAWLSSKHKFDFIVDYFNRRQLQVLFPDKNIKSKYSFDELETVLNSFLGQPEAKGILVNNYKALPDLQKQILQQVHFEGKSDDTVARELSKDDEYVEEKKVKAWTIWIGMLVQHANMALEKDYITSNLSSFISFNNGSLAKDKMLDFELALSSNKLHSKAYEQFESLIEHIKALSRDELRRYISINTSTKLSGNIWGKTWTWVSAGFIALMGILIWIVDNKEIPQKQDAPLQEQGVEMIDSTSESTEH